MGLTTVSVVVSTYQRPSALNCVLRGLSAQTVSPAEILIADDGSANETRDLVDQWKRFGLPIRHIWQPDNGFRKTQILNQAVLVASGSLLVFLDGDCIPFENFVRDHLAISESGCVNAGTRILASASFSKAIEGAPNWRPSHSWWYWLTRWLRRDINKAFPRLYLSDGRWRTFGARNWRLLRGCNFSVFKEDLLSVGGFDEAIQGWGREDSDLAVRLINSGLRIKTLKFSAQVLHLWHQEVIRDRLSLNEAHLQSAIKEGRIKALKGLASPGYQYSDVTKN
jgi:glycosyltransferase involved in cell wall biosynthesis